MTRSGSARATVFRAAIAAVVLGACFLAFGCSTSSPSTAPRTSSSGSSSATSGAPSAPAPGSAVPTYTVPVTRSIVTYLVRKGSLAPSGQRKVLPSAPAMASMVSLLLGPSATDSMAGLTSAIPAETTVGDLKIAKGTATVDLSRPFASSASLALQRLRLAQVVYTLTQFAEVQRVAVTVGGKPLTSFGGMSAGTPLTRADFAPQLPAIFVTTPLPYQQATSPLKVMGSADVFEAQFTVELWSPDGNKLASKAVRASAGTGTRGDFETTLSFSAKKHGTGALKVYDRSAKDGSVIDLVTIPVRM